MLYWFNLKKPGLHRLSLDPIRCTRLFGLLFVKGIMDRNSRHDFVLSAMRFPRVSTRVHITAHRFSSAWNISTCSLTPDCLSASFCIMADIPQLIKIGVSLKTTPNNGPVFFKSDGTRFGQSRTIKLLTGTKYKVDVVVKPGAVEATWVDNALSISKWTYWSSHCDSAVCTTLRLH